MLTVPLLATLTDRIDARKILIAGSAVSALGTLLFGLFATDLWSGAFCNAIAGVGFAGAYMPGLKALTDRLAHGDSSRAITFYTSSFSFGVGLSFLISQLVAEGSGWWAAFLVTALGPPVMLASAVVALLIGIFANKSAWFLLPLLLAYANTVPADSGALTSGMAMAAEPRYRGATMAMHSTVGFSLSALGAWVVGVALDASGGPQSASAWMAAFTVLAAGIL